MELRRVKSVLWKALNRGACDW